MKNKHFFGAIYAFLLLFMLGACDDRELIEVDNSATPIVMNISAESIFLDKHFPDNPALNVTWAPATYSQPVEINYSVQASSTQDFAKFLELGNVSGSAKTATFTASQLNKVATSLGLAKDIAAPLYIRVQSYLGSGVLSSASNITKVMVTPYELDYPTFYLVGAASYVGWNSPNAQLLYKKSNMSYIYTYMQPENFRFLGQQNWSPLNYSINADGTDTGNRYFNQVSSNVAFADHENMAFSGTAGIYKIAIDATNGTQSLTITPSAITSFDVPALYLSGSMNGNDASKGIAMTKTGVGQFSITTTLADDASFKFYGQQSAGSLEWGNILANNDGNSGFLGPKGDNSNIVYKGGNSNYLITVNLKAGTYTIVKQ